MDLTVEQIDRWVSGCEPGTYLVQLAAGDTMPTRDTSPRDTIEGPALVTVSVYRDGGWSAVVQRIVWTPEEIAL